MRFLKRWAGYPTCAPEFFCDSRWRWPPQIDRSPQPLVPSQSSPNTPPPQRVCATSDLIASRSGREWRCRFQRRPQSTTSRKGILLSLLERPSPAISDSESFRSNGELPPFRVEWSARVETSHVRVLPVCEDEATCSNDQGGGSVKQWIILVAVVLSILAALWVSASVLGTGSPVPPVLAGLAVAVAGGGSMFIRRRTRRLRAEASLSS